MTQRDDNFTLPGKVFEWKGLLPPSARFHRWELKARRQRVTKDETNYTLLVLALSPSSRGHL